LIRGKQVVVSFQRKNKPQGPEQSAFRTKKSKQVFLGNLGALLRVAVPANEFAAGIIKPVCTG
jgi:hypothetical protein